MLLKATHLPFVVAIWAYEKASGRWWSRKQDEENDIDYARFRRLGLNPQSHSRTVSSHVFPPHQIYQSTRSKLSNLPNRIDPPTEQNQPSAAVSRRNGNLPLGSQQVAGGEGVVISDARGASGTKSEVPVASELEELKQMVASLGELVRELNSRLDQQVLASQSEEDA
jgi:hypothetical protein